MLRGLYSGGWWGWSHGLPAVLSTSGSTLRHALVCERMTETRPKKKAAAQAGGATAAAASAAPAPAQPPAAAAPEIGFRLAGGPLAYRPPAFSADGRHLFGCSGVDIRMLRRAVSSPPRPVARWPALTPKPSSASLLPPLSPPPLVLSASTLALLRTLSGHTAEVTAVAANPKNSLQARCPLDRAPPPFFLRQGGDGVPPPTHLAPAAHSFHADETFLF